MNKVPTLDVLPLRSVLLRAAERKPNPGEREAKRVLCQSRRLHPHLLVQGGLRVQRPGLRGRQRLLGGRGRLPPDPAASPVQGEGGAGVRGPVGVAGRGTAQPVLP